MRKKHGNDGMPTATTPGNAHVQIAGLLIVINDMNRTMEKSVYPWLFRLFEVDIRLIGEYKPRGSGRRLHWFGRPGATCCNHTTYYTSPIYGWVG